MNSFSNSYLMLEGLKLVYSFLSLCLHLFFLMGIIFESFILLGNLPFTKEDFTISVSGIDYNYFDNSDLL